MDSTTAVGFVRNVADKHFSTQEKETLLTFMDNKLPDNANMIGALEDLGVNKTSKTTTVVLQSKNDQALNFEGHSGKLWQCETCHVGFTKKENFTMHHAIGIRKSHKLIGIFKQPIGLGKVRKSGWGKPDKKQPTDLKMEQSLVNMSIPPKGFKKIDAGENSGNFLCYNIQYSIFTYVRRW